MADDSSGLSNQQVNSDVLNDSDIQPHLIGGALRLHDSNDSSNPYDNPAFAESSTDPTPEVRNGHAGNGILLPPPPTKQDIQNQTYVTSAPKTIIPTSGSLPVVYDNRSGNNVVIQEPVVVNQSDGTREIQTRAIPERWRDLDRPLRQKRLKFLKIFGIIAIFFFFPTGIPACVYAFRAQKEFEAGIMRGNIDMAAKFARRAERLIVLSGILALVIGVLCFAMVERSMNPDRYVNWHPAGIVGQ